ncbi:hypothetical protein JCM9533A_29530 [Catenuloplanes niger JCM 9533]
MALSYHPRPPRSAIALTFPAAGATRLEATHHHRGVDVRKAVLIAIALIVLAPVVLFAYLALAVTG